MLEGPVEAFMAHFKSNRIKTSIIISVLCFLCGIPLSLNMGIFDNFSNLITIIISPLCALLVAVVFYYIIGGENVLIEVNKGAHKKTWKMVYSFREIHFYLSYYISNNSWSNIWWYRLNLNIVSFDKNFYLIINIT